MFEISAGRARGLAVWALLGVAGCVDVPEPADPQPADALSPAVDGAPDARSADRGAPDAAPDTRPPSDMAPDRDSAPDAAPMRDMAPAVDAAPAVDMGPPQLSECLELVSEPPPGELPCLRVRLVPGAAMRSTYPASINAGRGTAQERVVIVGGLDGTAEPAPGRRTVRSYDPKSNRWPDDVPDLLTGRWGAGVGELPDGSLVVMGGSGNREQGSIWQGIDVVHRWAPGDGSWAALGSLDVGRSQGAMVSVPAVGVAYIGGRPNQAGNALGAVDVVSPDATLIDGPPLGVPRTDAAAVVLPEHSTLVLGGFDGAGAAVGAIERIGGPEGVITELPAMPEPRGRLGAAPLPDGALFVGGVDARDGEPSAAAIRFDSLYNRFIEPEPLFIARDAPTVTAIGPEHAGWRLVVGGAPTNALPGVVELYDPNRDAFLAFQLPAPWSRHRAHHTAAAFSAGQGQLAVMVAGGYDPLAGPGDDSAYHAAIIAVELTLPEGTPEPLPTDCLELAEPAENAPCLRVRRGPPLPGPRTLAAAVAQHEGPLVVAGGLNRLRQSPLLDETVALHPGDRAWSMRPPLNVARAGHHMLALAQAPDAPLLAIGGIGHWDEGAFGGLASVEYRAGDDELWAQTRPLVVARVSASMVVVDDVILVVGGQSGGAPDPPLASTERFAFDGERRRGDLEAGRTRHVTCLLDADTALTYGGFTGLGASASFETYDPAGDAWTGVADGGTALGDSTCIGGGGQVDIFGGRETPDGEASRLWQRFSARAGVAIDIDRMARGRTQPTVDAIGREDGIDPAHIIVGGEDPGDEAGGPVVELIQRTRDRRFVYRLPPGVGPRRGHRAVSHRWEVRRVRDLELGQETPIFWRDVMVIGGEHADTGAPLDEVLIFGLDPYETLRDRGGGPRDPAPPN